MRWNDPHTHGLDRISPSASLDEIQGALIQSGWHFSSKPLLIIDGVEVVLGDRWNWYPDHCLPRFSHELWDETAECWGYQTIYWVYNAEVCQIAFALCVESLIYHSTACISHTTTSPPTAREITTLIWCTSTISTSSGLERHTTTWSTLVEGSIDTGICVLPRSAQTSAAMMGWAELTGPNPHVVFSNRISFY